MVDHCTCRICSTRGGVKTFLAAAHLLAALVPPACGLATSHNAWNTARGPNSPGLVFRPNQEQGNNYLDPGSWQQSGNIERPQTGGYQRITKRETSIENDAATRDLDLDSAKNNFIETNFFDRHPLNQNERFIGFSHSFTGVETICRDCNDYSWSKNRLHDHLESGCTKDTYATTKRSATNAPSTPAIDDVVTDACSEDATIFSFAKAISLASLNQ